MKYALPIIAMLCTAFATLLMLVFMMAGAANASPAQLRSMKLWTVGLSVLSLVCIVVGIVLIRQDRSGLAALVAIVPTLVMGCVLFWSLL